MIANERYPMCDHIEFLRYPIDESFSLLGRKWGMSVLLEIINGKDHFNALLDTIPGVNPRTLSARLDDLERSGVVRREAGLGPGPLRVTYKLTDKGMEMRRLIHEVATFSLKWHSTTNMTPFATI